MSWWTKSLLRSNNVHRGSPYYIISVWFKHHQSIWVEDSLNPEVVDDTVPIVAVMMIYETVVQNIAISVPLGMATAGFWEGEDNACMCRTSMLYDTFRQVYVLITMDDAFFKMKILTRKDWNIKRWKNINLQISRYVSSCQDSCGRRKENGEHAKKAALWPPPIGHKIGSKNIRC